jgi:hypothetical protein
MLTFRDGFPQCETSNDSKHFLRKTGVIESRSHVPPENSSPLISAELAIRHGQAGNYSSSPSGGLLSPKSVWLPASGAIAAFRPSAVLRKKWIPIMFKNSSEIKSLFYKSL